MLSTKATVFTLPNSVNNTKSVLHFEGSNGSTTITDECGITWTNGGITISTTVSKFGSSSILIPTNNDLIYSSDPVFNKAGLVPWTVECWFRVVSTSVWGSIITSGITGSLYDRPYSVTASNNAKIEVAISNAAMTNRSTYLVGSVSANTWYHIAGVADGTNITTYLDGVSIHSAAQPNWTSNASYQVFGTPIYSAGTNYVDEFRYSNFARYTGNFTPPASQFSAVG